jgi:hypothetical protein
LSEEINELDEKLSQHFGTVSFFDEGGGRQWLMDLPTSYARRVLASFALDMLGDIAGVSAAILDRHTCNANLRDTVWNMWVMAGNHILLKSDPARVMMDDSNLMHPPTNLEDAREWYKEEYEKRIALPMKVRMHSDNGLWAGHWK